MEESKITAVELGVSEAELKEPTTPDIHALFCHYNALYFHGFLGACVPSWSSTPPMNRCAGTCDYHPGGGCEIRLSEPLLKFRSAADLKNTLLHEMIHAFLWIKNEDRDHSNHGASFQDLMNAISSSSVVDHQKPFGGYNITIYHDFHKEVDSNRVYHWICGSCGDSIERTMDKEPSASDCIENVGQDESCSKPSCQWHSHKKLCSGSYTKKAESSGYKEERTSSKGEQHLNGDKFRGLHYRRTTRRSSKIEGTKENSGGEKTTTTANRIPFEGDVKGNSHSNSSGDGCQKGLRPEDNEKAIIILKDQDHNVAPEPPKRGRVTVAEGKPASSSRKKRKNGKVRTEFNVIIEWLGVYADEEAEEDVEPLINKRTERRKKQKLLRNLKFQAPDIDDVDDGSPFNTSSGCRTGEPSFDGNSLLLETKMEEHGVPQQPGKFQGHGHAEDDADTTETVGNSVVSQMADGRGPLPSNISPVRDDDVVDISDG